jgi:ABC-type branched-subunit amino acid transport system ATPase component
MKLRTLQLEKFKKVEDVVLNLEPLNILVGNNNAGKSSVLQGVHFSVIAAIASREAGQNTYTQDALMYCPARKFASLRNGRPYSNQSDFGFLRLVAEIPDEEGLANYEVKIYRGRNDGNVGCIRNGNTKLGSLIASGERLFSVYVPGLAGVPQVEHFHAESVVRRGVASGDANLYLRNVLLLIQQKNKLDQLSKLMLQVFPKFHLAVSFDPVREIYVEVQVSTTGQAGRHCPLELAGTGVLQALQIFSYVTLFEPSLLLLDEPDSHLHPENQSLLASALQAIVSTTATTVIVSTHSRHLVEALYDDANLVWLKGGKVHQQGIGISRLPVLLELGALDSFDLLQNGGIEWVFLTEDSGQTMLKALVQAAGFPIARTLFYTYKTSSNLEAAKILASFISEIAPATRVVIHRDRDFMTDQEAQEVSDRIADCGATPFITDGCDVEAYFAAAAHLATRLNVAEGEIATWLDGLAQAEHMHLQHAFTRKRDEIRTLLYRNRPNEFPDTLHLLGNAIPLPIDKRLGKEMLKRVRGAMHQRFGHAPDLVVGSPHLVSARLQQIFAEAASNVA